MLFEWLRGWLFTGFPWLNLGYTQIDGPLAGYAPVVGVYGVSLLVALSGGLLWGLIRWSGRRRLAAGLGLAAIWLGGRRSAAGALDPARRAAFQGQRVAGQHPAGDQMDTGCRAS